MHLKCDLDGEIGKGMRTLSSLYSFLDCPTPPPLGIEWKGSTGQEGNSHGKVTGCSFCLLEVITKHGLCSSKFLKFAFSEMTFLAAF